MWSARPLVMTRPKAEPATILCWGALAMTVWLGARAPTDPIIITGSGGGEDGDSFCFTSNGLGQDVIKDFFADGGDTSDRLVIADGINGRDLAAPADLTDGISSDDDGNAVIDLGGGNAVTLENVTVEDSISHYSDWIEVV